MTEQKTLVEALEHQAALRPARAAFTIDDAPEDARRTIGFADLRDAALRVATGLKSQGLRRGDRVLLCLPTGLDLLASLYGVLAAGGVVVPVYPPFASRTLGAWKDRVTAAARTVQPAGAIVCEQNALHMRAVLAHQGPGLFTATPGALDAEKHPEPAVDVDPGDLGLIQLTSGTTSAPRGAAISHGNLMANSSALIEAMSLDEHTVSVSWLPPYHDMGLIGHVFTPLCCGAHQHLMSPRTFRDEPVRWLRLITEVKATQTTAPNAAYEICARRLTGGERIGLDLSSLRWALNGAEQVHVETIDRFCSAFGPHGFQRRAMRPVYGLAEATLAAAFGSPEGPEIDRVDRAALTRGKAERSSALGDVDGQSLVSVGHAIPGHEIRIVDEEGRPVAFRRVGEVCFRGPSVMQGYFNDPVATAAVITDDGWLRTGDLGYLCEDGSLHVTGRRRELIIKNGRNYTPHDIEGALDVVPGLRAGRAVACGVPWPAEGTEAIVLVVEARRPSQFTDDELRRRVADAVYDATGARVDQVEIVSPGTLPKTTSGKLRRGAVRKALVDGANLEAGATAPSLADTVAPGLRSLASLVEARVSRALGWR